MTFISILLALIIEEHYSFSKKSLVYRLLQFYITAVSRYFNKNKLKNSALGWIAIVLPCVLFVSVIYFLLHKINSLLGITYNIIILYFMLGFRAFSHYSNEVYLALNNSNIHKAQKILNEWTGIDTRNMTVIEIIRYTLIYAIIESHRYVFGVLFWFVILPLPFSGAGAVLYRISEYLVRCSLSHLTNDDNITKFLSVFSRRMFFFIDWIPTRLTSLSFAIVGNFEDTIYAWRNYTNRWSDPNLGVLLTSFSGALCTQLSRETFFEPLNFIYDIEKNIDDSNSINEQSQTLINKNKNLAILTLQAAINLFWRVVILWMTLLLMFTISSYIF